jgi:hypothetical protein
MQSSITANGIVFPELDYDGLCAAIVGTSRVLLRPGLNAIVHLDHMLLWAWCGELLLSPPAEFFSDEQHEIKELAEATLRASLVFSRKPSQTKEERKAQERREELQQHNSRCFLSKSHTVLAYLAFPFVEAILKKACNQFVEFDGTVKTQFAVRDKTGAMRAYDPNGRRKQCSSLRDLLFLHQAVAAPDLADGINALGAHFIELFPSVDPFDLIYMWRSQSLHGAMNFQTIGGSVLNLALLIALSELKNTFEGRRQVILEHCRWEAQFGSRSIWSYYPPF